MKWSAKHDDLSLLPQITANDKAALRRGGVCTTRELAGVRRRMSGGHPSPLRNASRIHPRGRGPMARCLSTERRADGVSFGRLSGRVR